MQANLFHEIKIQLIGHRCTGLQNLARLLPQEAHKQEKPLALESLAPQQEAHKHEKFNALKKLENPSAA